MRIAPAVLLLMASVAAGACVHHGTHAPPTAISPDDSVHARWITKTPPPAAYTEAPPPKPHPNDVWVPGWFKWDGRGFEWVTGRWLPPPAGTHDWVPGTWVERHDGRWQFIDGHWQ
jgi:WXXGXW repeat (2 copies)